MQVNLGDAPVALDNGRLPAAPPAPDEADLPLQTFIGDLAPATDDDAPLSSVVIRQASALAWLVPLTGASGTEHVQLGERFTIGRDPSSDLVLLDRSATRRHAEIWREQGKYHIRDSETTNGTRVNGTRVTTAELQDGDEIRIGSAVLLFVQAISPGSYSSAARRRVHDFDEIWNDLVRAVRDD